MSKLYKDQFEYLKGVVYDRLTITSYTRQYGIMKEYRDNIKINSILHNAWNQVIDDLELSKDLKCG